ncbi:MAG TPA: S8 family serine peptidase [Candidatus Thermoplasmatota archaeon]|jgi:hypothetical protein|nr:S8 family serine peptidase [Candidatus Thermoplasmatota archaeon]
MRRALSIAIVLVLGSPLALAALPPAPSPAALAEPIAVVALIDSGINPYHVAFRDPSPLAEQHPCTYIPGYPCSAIALDLSLDAPDFATARAADHDLWENLLGGQLYWIPGTKIIGAISLGAGGVRCPLVDIPPANAVNRPGGIVASTLGLPPCPDDLPILDEHGHGTMTASRAAGNDHSLCPSCRIVEIEGLGAEGVRWAADQGWIDVQSNSWLNLVPPPVENLGDDPANPMSVGLSFEYAAQRMPTLAASGNGAGYIMGFAPTPTYALSTAAPGVLLVGGHDNGHVTAWAGAPAHVAADAFGGWAAANDDLTRWEPDPISCCTSAAAPYAAGGAAAVILEARRIFADVSGPGIHGGVVARASSGDTPVRGPLSDGVFTLEELTRVYRHTAQPRPVEGRDDGLLHFMAGAAEGEPLPVDLLVAHGLGTNPFCQGCWTLPVPWALVPADLPQFPLIGYGAVNEHSVALASAVFQGVAPEPARAIDDQLYALDQQLRADVFFAHD